MSQSMVKSRAEDRFYPVLCDKITRLMEAVFCFGERKMICPHCGKNTEEPPEEEKSGSWFTSKPLAPEPRTKKIVARKPFNDLDWRITRGRIKRRDGYQCARCKTKEGLTVHHIVPRDDGGGDHDGNLITLCEECHNYVELACLTLRSEIIGSYDEKVYDAMNNQYRTIKNYGDDVEYRPPWHQRVYGGAKGDTQRQNTKPDYSRLYGPMYEISMLVSQGIWFPCVDMNFCTVEDYEK